MNFQFLNFQKKINSTFRSGFTLIELIVTTTLIVILTTIGISSYNNMNETQTLRDAGSDLKNNLRMAQNKVANGEKVCGATACGGTNSICDGESGETPLLGWQIEFNSLNYDIYGLCGADGTTKFNSKTYSVLGTPSVAILARETLTFKAFPTTVVNAGDICLLGFNKYYKITVSSSGEINDSGIVSSCP